MRNAEVAKRVVETMPIQSQPDGGKMRMEVSGSEPINENKALAGIWGFPRK